VVELDELVALVVRSDIKGGKSLLATDQEDTSVDTSVVLSVDTLATKEVLAGSLKTSVETTYIFIRNRTKTRSKQDMTYRSGCWP
jgi:hypothetical protein